MAVELRPGRCLINGRWIDSDERLAVHDPATGERIGSVPRLDREATQQAIDAAQLAFPAWSARTAEDRATFLIRLNELMKGHREELARILTTEQGKPILEACSEIDYAASYLVWFAEEAKRAYGEIIPSPRDHRRLFVLKQPIGVVAAITPWNFPAAMLTRKLAPALAAGCTIVIKPAEQTPLTALAIATLIDGAGIPAGVVNVITGDPEEIGAVLTSSAKVRKLSFTGSTRTGALLAAQSASTIKNLSLELGGNAPFIVLDDADLEAAVDGAIQAKFRNAGQTCVCANRFYVQSGIYEAFVAQLERALGGLTVGPGLDPSSQIGPLIDERAMTKLQDLVANALERGGRLVSGGARHAAGRLFFTPTLIADVDPSARAVQEEIFGPLVAVIPFEADAEAIRMANASEFGLAAYVFGRDLVRVWRMVEALETGMVGVNTGLISTEVAPFGGIKQSGLGREGARRGLADYLEDKYVCLDLGTAVS